MSHTFFAGTSIWCRYAEVGSFEALAICPKFLRADFYLDENRSSFPDRSELSSFSDAQPHLVPTRKRCAYQDFECMIIIFRDDGDVFDAHNPSLRVSEPPPPRLESDTSHVVKHDSTFGPFCVVIVQRGMTFIARLPDKREHSVRKLSRNVAPSTPAPPIARPSRHARA